MKQSWEFTKIEAKCGLLTGELHLNILVMAVYTDLEAFGITLHKGFPENPFFPQFWV